VCRDEDDWYLNVRRRELALKVKTAAAGQPDIEHEASGSVRASFIQELGNRSQRLGVLTDRSDQAAERLADQGVVVDNDNGRRFSHRRRSLR
jgi:hypothetical protein